MLDAALDRVPSEAKRIELVIRKLLPGFVKDDYDAGADAESKGDAFGGGAAGGGFGAIGANRPVSADRTLRKAVCRVYWCSDVAGEVLIHCDAEPAKGVDEGAAEGEDEDSVTVDEGLTLEDLTDFDKDLDRDLLGRPLYFTLPVQYHHDHHGGREPTVHLRIEVDDPRTGALLGVIELMEADLLGKGWKVIKYGSPRLTATRQDTINSLLDIMSSNPNFHTYGS